MARIVYSKAFREGFYASDFGRGKNANPYGSKDDEKYDQWQAGWEARYYREVSPDTVLPLPVRKKR